MIVAATALTVLINGSLVSASHPARLVAGHVLAPLGAVVDRIATARDVDPRTGEITLVRAGHHVVLRLDSFEGVVDGTRVHLEAAPFRERDEIFVPLAPVARAFQVRLVFDGRTRTVAIGIPRDDQPLATMSPFDPRATSSPIVYPSPTVPPTATPRPVESGSPRPRRTPIPAGSLYGVRGPTDRRWSGC